MDDILKLKLYLLNIERFFFRFLYKYEFLHLNMRQQRLFYLLQNLVSIFQGVYYFLLKDYFHNMDYNIYKNFQIDNNMNYHIFEIILSLMIQFCLVLDMNIYLQFELEYLMVYLIHFQPILLVLNHHLLNEYF